MIGRNWWLLLFKSKAATHFSFLLEFLGRRDYDYLCLLGYNSSANITILFAYEKAGTMNRL